MRLHPDLRARLQRVYSTGREAWPCGMGSSEMTAADQWREQGRGVTVVLAQGCRCLTAITVLGAHNGEQRPATLLGNEE